MEARQSEATRAALAEAALRTRLMLAELDRAGPGSLSDRLAASHFALTCSVSPAALEAARRATKPHQEKNR